MEELIEQYKIYQAMNLKLNMARGNPCKEQLDLSMPMMNILNFSDDMINEEGFDCRNYGVYGGISECKKLLAQIGEVSSDNVLVFGNSSLNIMYSLISNAMSHGVNGSTPWCKLNKVKWLCVVPGYDRHFAICEYFGIEMINVPMLQNGPDMDIIEGLVSKDESIKGIWCVPMYSNPDGTTYSDETIKRFANLKPASKDFRIYWDNAYCVHHLYEDKQDHVLEILNECQKANNPDLVYKFISTSKISFPGAGVAALISSTNNLEFLKKFISTSIICYDKINELRHAKFFKNLDDVKKQMIKHANIIRPKFELVESILAKQLSGLNVKWTKPNGGYFISLDVPGHAKQVIQMCKDCGVILTPAGSTYPYHNDQNNSNIRIAPTYPSIDDLKLACEIMCLCIKIELSRDAE